jgi:hypothetical protein
MIQVEIPASSEAASELERMQSALREAGFVMDTKQPPVRIGTKGSRRYVLRGYATQTAIDVARKRLRFVVLPDLQVREF